MPVSFSIADSTDAPRKVIIWVTGDLDADTSRAVRARLAQAQRHSRSDVVLDMTGVTFVDSAGLNEIVAGAEALRASGRLSVISPPPRVAALLHEAGLAKLIELVENRRRRDRRRRNVPVEFDRRKGGDRRHDPEAGIARPLRETA